MHKPIRFQDLSLYFPHKTCFADFSGQILYGSRIAIIGSNGQGKSTLLKILQGTYTRYEGNLTLPDDLCLGYLPQKIDSFESLSGGERLNKALTEALSTYPNLLLLDEPTNHLDKSNRRALINYLRHYPGTLIIVTHDVELLKNSVDTLWHIENGKITIFNGNYYDYQGLQIEKRAAIEHELALIKQQKKEVHHALMREQERSKAMSVRGEKSIENRKWPTIRSHTKLGNAIKTGDKRLNQIKETQNHLVDKLSMYNLPEIISHKFKLNANAHQSAVITIKDATIAYEKGPTVLTQVNFHMRSRERVTLLGDNGSGKSTFIKAILDNPEIKKLGEWTLPARQTVGYLDQHYQTLDVNKTVLDTVYDCMSSASIFDIRKHLNDFLFRKNEEVEIKVSDLSGGEKARLSLCCIAASPPNLLILDEMTNNLDLETRAHVIQILKEYPGAMIVISHDQDFLNQINIETSYLLSNKKIVF